MLSVRDIFYLFIYLFIYLVLAVLGLCFCARALHKVFKREKKELTVERVRAN